MTFVSPPVIPRMPQFRAPSTISRRATGSSRLSMSMLFTSLVDRTMIVRIVTSSCNPCNAVGYAHPNVPEYREYRTVGDVRSGCARLPVPGARGQRVLVEVALELVQLRRVDRVGVLVAREAAVSDVVGV